MAGLLDFGNGSGSYNGLLDPSFSTSMALFNAGRAQPLGPGTMVGYRQPSRGGLLGFIDPTGDYGAGNNGVGQLLSPDMKQNVALQGVIGTLLGFGTGPTAAPMGFGARMAQAAQFGQQAERLAEDRAIRSGVLGLQLNGMRQAAARDAQNRDVLGRVFGTPPSTWTNPDTEDTRPKLPDGTVLDAPNGGRYLAPGETVSYGGQPGLYATDPQSAISALLGTGDPRLMSAGLALSKQDAKQPHISEIYDEETGAPQKVILDSAGNYTPIGGTKAEREQRDNKPTVQVMRDPETGEDVMMQWQGGTNWVPVGAARSRGVGGGDRVIALQRERDSLAQDDPKRAEIDARIAAVNRTAAGSRPRGPIPLPMGDGGRPDPAKLRHGRSYQLPSGQIGIWDSMRRGFSTEGE